MVRSSLSALAVLLSITMSFAVGAAETITVGEKAALQAAMQRHISDHQVDGGYLYLDSKSGDVRALYPVNAHPKVMRMGPYFVLCYDFRDEHGNAANVDYFVARRGKEYVVFQREIDNRALLMRLMREGKVGS